MNRLNIKKTVLSCLFLLIIVTAHPSQPTQSIAVFLEPYLDAFGTNIYFQPLTFDMIFMYDTQRDVNLYKHDMDIVYQTVEGVKHIPLETISFHGVRAPILWFSEYYYYGDDTHSHIYALCHQLKQKYGPGEGFRIQVDIDDQLVRPFGLNMVHSCQ